MHRNYLLNALSAYKPCSIQEGLTKQQIINFVKNNEDCFLRSLEVGHITASAWVLNHDRSKALLMHHKKLHNWFQLGGHCDGDSNTLSVALKEAQEESGIMEIAPIYDEIFDVDVHLIPENANEKSHYHYDIRYLLQVTKDQPLIGNPESNAVQWFTKDITKLPTKEASILRMFGKWLEIA